MNPQIPARRLAPAFLLANDMIARAGQPSLGIFGISAIGLALVVVGVLYMLGARWLLPKRSGEHGDDDYMRLDSYRTELIVSKESRWNTRPLAELQKALDDKFRLLGWLRDGVPGGQVVLAWLLSRSEPSVLPLIGPRTPAQYRSAIGASGVVLGADHLARLDATGA